MTNEIDYTKAVEQVMAHKAAKASRIEHQGWCPENVGGDCECICEHCSQPVEMSEYGVAYTCECRS